MYLSAAKNDMLTAFAPDAASLHSAWPGLTGANELSGGGYARVAPAIGAYAGGVRVGASNTWTVGAASTVAWVFYWKAGVAYALAPNGGSPKEFGVDTASDLIRCDAHGYSDGQTIVFYNGTVPGGLVEGTVYYVRDSAADTFKVAATLGGVAIDLTSVGTTGCQVSAITVENYASADTHSITSATFGLPF